MKFLKNLFSLSYPEGYAIPTNKKAPTEKVPVFNPYSPRSETIPTLPFSCKVSSFDGKQDTYAVEVSKECFWSCSCLGFEANGLRNNRWCYYCEHCKRVSEITGIPRPEYKWRAKVSGQILTGEVLEEGMTVYGYLTPRELRADFTDGQVKNLLGEPDEAALFDTEGSCKLYLRSRVEEVISSPEYQQARERYYALADSRKAAAAKAKATRERKEQERLELRAAERASFVGKVYIANLEHKYGWEQWSVYAQDEESARTLFKESLASPHEKSEVKQRFDDAVEDYREELRDYREERRESMHDLKPFELEEPVKPLRSDFILRLVEVVESDLDPEEFEINDVQLVNFDGGYHFSRASDS